MKIGEESKPRFEFRSFGHDFDRAARQMEILSAPVPDFAKKRHSEEIYFLDRDNIINNTKLRYGIIDIKRLVKRDGILEQWKPVLKLEFPLTRDVLVNDIYLSPMVGSAEFMKELYSMEDFVEHIETQNKLVVARVTKTRFGFMINDTICEYCDVEIAGVRLATVAIESVEPADILRTISDVGLEGIENINYPEAIRMVLGIAEKSF